MESGDLFAESELIALSGLQHIVFCERQFALMVIEQVWADNELTVDGAQFHQRIDSAGPESRGDVRIARSVPLRSLRLGVSGRADVVEFWRDAGGVVVAGLEGRWRPYPVEYKRGRPKSHRADEVQLCAQGMCLEEMLGAEVPSGALFYGQERRRTEVPFDPDLRGLVEWAARRARELIARAETPPAQRGPKCTRCSLLEICCPDAGSRSAVAYVAAALRGPTAEGPRR